MCELWLGWSGPAEKDKLVGCLKAVAPQAMLAMAGSAADLRERFRDEEPGTVGAVIGGTDKGVSAINLAAAIVHDGMAGEVVLVVEKSEQSIIARAQRAGITRVLDYSLLPAVDAVAAVSQAVPVAAAVPVAVSAPPVQTAQPASLPTEHQQRSAPAAVAERSGGQGGMQVASPVRRASSGGPVLAFASGRGGVGKTALVALTSALAGRWGMRVAAVDLDLVCGNLYSAFGVTRPADIARIAEGGAPTEDRMERACVKCCEGVNLWGPCEKPELAELVSVHVGALLDFLSSKHDLVVVDCSSTFTDAVAQAAQICDRLLLVHDESAGSISSLSRMSALAVRLGVARTRIVRVTNLCDPRVRPPLLEERAEVGLETARLFRIPDGGIEAEEQFASGKVSELAASKAEPAAAVAGMLAQILSELGKLPEHEGAKQALDSFGRRKRQGLFGRKRGVA